ncbi:MAG: NAD(+)/NADH kinase [Bryobacteraceae bacterium]
MEAIKSIGILSKPKSPEAITLVPEVIAWLEHRGIGIRMDAETAAYAGRTDGVERESVPDGVQLVMVLGGDGTLLSAARAIAGREIPLFAVNLGSLGFLTAITVEQLFPELERALRGEHRIGQRRMLHCEVWRGAACISQYEALNDAVISKAEIARMSDLVAHVDNHFVCVYKADGLILSTPTGSTAYSLAAGGPIMFPQVSALCITPICPHMLTNRPVIVPDTSTIQILNRGEDNSTYLTIDGQVGELLMHGDRVVCRQSKYAIHLVRPPRMLFFDVLREKLKWGER